MASGLDFATAVRQSQLVDVAAGEGRVVIVGRESELAVVRAWVADDSPARTLVVSGGPGIGKTTLWGAGIDAARERAVRVLLARPSGAEARLSFGGLIDLFDGVEIVALPGAPDTPTHSAGVS